MGPDESVPKFLKVPIEGTFGMWGRTFFVKKRNFEQVFLPSEGGLDQISCCSSVVEHFLGKEEVGSSILLNSSDFRSVTWIIKQKQKVK